MVVEIFGPTGPNISDIAINIWSPLEYLAPPPQIKYQFARLQSIGFAETFSKADRSGSNCGLFSIANGTALIFGEDPGTLFYDQASMRPHHFKCLESKCMLPFPIKRVRRALKQVVTVDSFEVHCICRMPEMCVGGKWAECTECDMVPQDSCLNASDEMFERRLEVPRMFVETIIAIATQFFILYPLQQ